MRGDMIAKVRPCLLVIFFFYKTCDLSGVVLVLENTLMSRVVSMNREQAICRGPRDHDTPNGHGMLAVYISTSDVSVGIKEVCWQMTTPARSMRWLLFLLVLQLASSLST